MSHGCGDNLHAYLRGNYDGDCDESTELAHGRGEAQGADRYVGDWVQGKPSGKGVYVWENGRTRHSIVASFAQGGYTMRSTAVCYLARTGRFR